MNTAMSTGSDTTLWDEEPASRADRSRIRARIGGLHCSLCTGTIEKALGKIKGVDHVAVSLTHEQVLVEFAPEVVSPQEILRDLQDIGYTVSDPRKLRSFEDEEADLVVEGKRFLAATGFSLVAISLIANLTGFWAAVMHTVIFATLLAFLFLVLRRSRGKAAAAAGAAAFSIGAMALVFLKEHPSMAPAIPYIVAALALILVFFVGHHILMMAYQALRRGILNQHVLLEIGAFAGIVGGTIGLVSSIPSYPTAAFFAVTVMVVTYHIFSEWLSLIVKTRSSQAVKKLLDLQPDIARVVRQSQTIEVPIGDVVVGDLVRIRPGDRVPVDGKVIDGYSSVNESLVSGEPIPVEKLPGHAVIGGSTNGTGSLLVEVTAVGATSFLQQIIRHVEDARALKPGLLHLVDRILRVYTPTVLVIAALAVTGWLIGPLIFVGQAETIRAIFAGLSVLVMGYPCAVGISAPLSIVRGAGEAADQGIIMRTGEAFQAYRTVTHIALDKTGTLTQGKPTVRKIIAHQVTEQTLLSVAGAVEASSEHPLAQAVLEAARAARVTLPDVDSFNAIPGKGITAVVNGVSSLVGSPLFLAQQGVDLEPLQSSIVELEHDGNTVIGVAQNKQLIGILAIGDALRPDAVTTIAALRKAGIKPVLITGDNERAARHVASQLGIDQVHAHVLPDQKAEIIRQLQEKGRVAMVGDGINDAPALMQANIGIAMGSGTDIAIESADIIILGSRLEALLIAREISRHSYRKMVQNITLAFMFNGVGIPLAATGLIYPVWAMVAMAVSVTAIFFNSLWGRPSLFFDAILTVGQPVNRPVEA